MLICVYVRLSPLCSFCMEKQFSHSTLAFGGLTEAASFHITLCEARKLTPQRATLQPGFSTTDQSEPKRTSKAYILSVTESKTSNIEFCSYYLATEKYPVHSMLGRKINIFNTTFNAYGRWMHVYPVYEETTQICSECAALKKLRCPCGKLRPPSLFPLFLEPSCRP